MAQECVFCRIAQGDISSVILYQDDWCFVIRDLYPKAPVHLLVMPLCHFTSLFHLTEERERMIGHLFVVAEEVAKWEGITDQGYRCVINQGNHAGQEVAHLHLHVLGGRPLGGMVS